MDKSWMLITDRLRSSEYANGVKEFITLARSHANGSDEIRCPCTLCSNNYFLPFSEVERHLFIRGIDKNYTVWIFHGDEEYLSLSDDDNLHDSPHDDQYIDDIDIMLEDIQAGRFSGVPSNESFNGGGTTSVEPESTKSFDQLLVDAHRPLYEGCTKYSKLSFLVKLLHIKTLGGWSVKSFDMLLQLLKSAFPNALLPNSYQESRSLLRGLGFTYTKIHACLNDCILYWKENADKEECPKCKVSRWIFSKSKQKNIPQKVLRHFPLKPRLQRLFMSQKIAAEMRWHRDQRMNEHGVLRHPADSEVWKAFDQQYSWFAQDSRNVRLGLASDGFNPFNNLSKPYSIWPVILVPYNLPPWLCMKDQFFMTSLLIPGPRSPGNEIDVYLQPLIDELIDLWENGVDTYDAMTAQTFRLHATLFWTINDFPAYGNLSGWSTKGKMACPSCRQETDSMWLTYSRKHCYMGHRRFLPSGHNWRKKKSIFNGSVEHREPPAHLAAEDIINEIQNIPFNADFGKANKKRKRTTEELNWTKKNIFFQLPYWSRLKIRHNLDVMHIEKNICDNILGTLMNITGKTKDHVNARRDLSNLNIRKELQLNQDGQRITMPHACFTLYGVERTGFCNWLHDVKFPDGFASNIARCVSVVDCKISDIRLALTEFSTFFKELCARTCKVDVLERLQADIAIILCKLEMIFPPSFFDVMVHLAYHLPREALLAGPVQYRWMYPFERYLGKFKKYVKNKARPEGSIAEAYIHVECLNFCSMYLHDVETRLNPQERNFDGGEHGVQDGLRIFRQKVRPMGGASRHQLDKQLFVKANWYVLNNCEEIGQYLNEHYMQISEDYSDNVDCMHAAQFPSWFKTRIQNLCVSNPGEVSEDLYALACGPDPWVASYSGCIINGIRFHTRQREEHRRTQNSGVLVMGELGTQSVEFYGVLIDILEFRYMGWRRVYVFRCEWFDISDPRRGIRVGDHLTSVNMSRTFYKDEPFVLACQALQVFYLKNSSLTGNWYVVQKVTNRNVYDIPQAPDSDDDASEASDVDAYQEDNSSAAYVSVQFDDGGIVTPMHRLDVEATQIDASIMGDANRNNDDHTFINDDNNDTSSAYSADHEGSTEGDNPSTDDDNLSIDEDTN
ncbi:uncharacterized protein LOC122279468 [Carya illinoinensis]|uniref:uncharacterized protein LOC122279468 n=1 Tax=Carya illinoinensis TaxID=32201 RepID=UPI001C71A9B9|nr:uncharacterized protein LOC122279468 [Carya illinoinensis]